MGQWRAIGWNQAMPWQPGNTCGVSSGSGHCQYYVKYAGTGGTVSVAGQLLVREMANRYLDVDAQGRVVPLTTSSAASEPQAMPPPFLPPFPPPLRPPPMPEPPKAEPPKPKPPKPEPAKPSHRPAHQPRRK